VNIYVYVCIMYVCMYACVCVYECMCVCMYECVYVNKGAGTVQLNIVTES